MPVAFAKMSFDKQLASIARRGATLRVDLQTVIVRAHVEYARDKQDFDAVARVLAAARMLSPRNAAVIAEYFKEHGPYDITYAKDPKTGRMRYYCKQDKTQVPAEFHPMIVNWADWDEPKADAQLKGFDKFEAYVAGIIKDADKDTQEQKWSPAAHNAAREVRNILVRYRNNHDIEKEEGKSVATDVVPAMPVPAAIPAGTVPATAH